MQLDRWLIQMRKGTLEFLVLLCLKEQEYYGYSLLQRLKKLANISVTEGTIYPLLSRLQTAGHVENRWQIMETGPARKYYMITDEGEKMASEMYNAWQEINNSIVNAWSKLDG